MGYINLYNVLSEKDKAILNNYITTYGVSDPNFIGLESWLQNWSHSKQYLYKLLGNQFIKEFDYEYEKNEKELTKEIYDKLFTLNFKLSYHNFYKDIIVPLNEQGKLSNEARSGFNHLTNADNFINDKVALGIKYKKENTKKYLQIQPGMKPVKALRKIIEYFKDDYTFEGFEDFRIMHSIILTTKKVVGKVCISIHPIDFITMSDNNSGWSSCMSWTDDGCYHVGTVEMMNSNNVLCCYLKSKDSFNFEKGSSVPNPLMECSNKRWRTLAYVTKDIIMSGKSYPYKDDDLSQKIITLIKDLAFKNMNWTYSYGPELYQDMKYINSSYSVERARKYIQNNDTKKHNIIWDTKGMYNDMLNDHHTKYWCYRNKVNRTKIISVSGKANCLCCNNSVIDFNPDYEMDYNERFENCGSTICFKCSENLTCSDCGVSLRFRKTYKIKTKEKEHHFCKRCFEKKVKICPCCGKPMVLSPSSIIYLYYYKDLADIKDINLNDYKDPWCSISQFFKENDDFEFMFMCEDCLSKNISKFDIVDVKKYYEKSKIYVLKDNVSKNFYPENFFYNNLKPVNFNEIKENDIIAQSVSRKM